MINQLLAKATVQLTEIERLLACFLYGHAKYDLHTKIICHRLFLRGCNFRGAVVNHEIFFLLILGPHKS